MTFWQRRPNFFISFCSVKPELNEVKVTREKQTERQGSGEGFLMVVNSWFFITGGGASRGTPLANQNKSNK